MGFFDKLFGRNAEAPPQQPQQRGNMYGGQQGGWSQGGQRGGQQGGGQLTDEQAVARYRYMLQTAPPETIEQAHEEAFSQLTPEQRRIVLQQLSDQLPAHERAAGVNYQDDPKSLARMATRAEMRQPGTLERTWNSMPAGGGMGMGGIGMGGLMAGTFLSSMAGMFVGSMIANQFFGDHGYNEGSGGGDQAGEHGNANDPGQDNTDAGGDTGDYGADYASSDMGGGYGGGDFGGDFGGGDFGGGDFGGDFG